MKYEIKKAACFRRTKEEWGGFSNMCSGYPLLVGGVDIRTSEALYQALRFANLETQRLIIEQRSPIAAKMKSRRYRAGSRSDWNQVRVPIMRWCLEIKLTQNWDKFSKLLLESGDLPIVEYSKKDAFWGAKPVKEALGYLEGENTLGKLLMGLREAIKLGKLRQGTSVMVPPLVRNMVLYGRKIGEVFPVESASKTGMLDRKYLGKIRGTLLSLKGRQGDPTGWFGGDYVRFPKIGLDLDIRFGSNPYLAEGGPLVIEIVNPEVAQAKRGKGIFSEFLAEVERLGEKFSAAVFFRRPTPRMSGFLSRRGYVNDKSGCAMYLPPSQGIKTYDQLCREVLNG